MFFNDSQALLDMMNQEEDFILKSSEQRRVIIDLYETDLTPEVIDRLLRHIENIRPRIIKLVIATDIKGIKVIKKAIKGRKELNGLYCYFSPDMEEGKKWLVSDSI